MSECSKKILDNNAESALDHSQYLSGKGIVEYTSEHVFANPVVKRKIYVKFVLLT